MSSSTAFLRNIFWEMKSDQNGYPRSLRKTYIPGKAEKHINWSTWKRANRTNQLVAPVGPLVRSGQNRERSVNSHWLMVMLSSPKEPKVLLRDSWCRLSRSNRQEKSLWNET